MKKLLAIGYIVLLLLPVTINAYTFGSFFINQEEIIALFCENKDKPAMQCNGQCHLAKTLQEQQPNAADEKMASRVESLPYLAFQYVVLVEEKWVALQNKAKSRPPFWRASRNADVKLPPPKGIQV